VLHPLGYRLFRRAGRLTPETDPPAEPRRRSVFAVIRAHAGMAPDHKHGHSTGHAASIHADYFDRLIVATRACAVVVTVPND
jgi:hypothetical protein